MRTQNRSKTPKSSLVNPSEYITELLCAIFYDFIKVEFKCPQQHTSRMKYVCETIAAIKLTNISIMPRKFFALLCNGSLPPPSVSRKPLICPPAQEISLHFPEFRTPAQNHPGGGDSPGPASFLPALVIHHGAHTVHSFFWPSCSPL